MTKKDLVPFKYRFNQLSYEAKLHAAIIHAEKNTDLRPITEKYLKLIFDVLRDNNNFWYDLDGNLLNKSIIERRKKLKIFESLDD